MASLNSAQTQAVMVRVVSATVPVVIIRMTPSTSVAGSLGVGNTSSSLSNTPIVYVPGNIGLMGGKL